jgi:HAMP domain-containing protein
VIMSAALATRQYTLEQVKPQLEVKYDFLVQSVSAYAAKEAIALMGRQFPEFRYREAALNPTNPRDQADTYETEVVQKFARDATLKEYSEVRDTGSGRAVFVARPLRVTNGACLTCHSVPDAAPKTMLAAYGGEHGFGWQLDQVVGAQVVTVPTSLQEQRVATIFRSVMPALLGVFAMLLVVLNVLVHLVVTARVRRMSRIAELVSRGKAESEKFETTGTDELSALGRSFGRLRVSLVSAMKILEP